MPAHQSNIKRKAKKTTAPPHSQRTTTTGALVQTVPQWMIPCILLLGFLAFVPALGADFVNWDDQDYVINNSIIKDFSNWRLILTRPIQGNYHPITMLTLAINYAISGLDAWS